MLLLPLCACGAAEDEPGKSGWQTGCGDQGQLCCSAGEERWVVLASDGLFANEERGGGGGLSNEEVSAAMSKCRLTEEAQAEQFCFTPY